MKMKLIKMSIRNFMGIKELEIDFGGTSTKVYGDNGVGKTSLLHAFNWLLFDKNAYAKTEFGIKPYDAENQVIHRLETSVEALFDIDGKPKSFKKVLKEKWTRKRGTAEDTYNGNENEYYINTVPKKKKEYVEEISTLIDEKVFRMLTNPLHFNENIDWQTRREMLIDICGSIGDIEIIRSNTELLPLADCLQGYTVEELKSVVTSEMRNINKELGILPSRIAEAELAKPNLQAVDTSALADMEKELADLEQKKSDILHGIEISRLKNALNESRLLLSSKEHASFNKQSLDEYKEMSEISYTMTKTENFLSLWENTTLGQINVKIEANSKRKQQMSAEWDEILAQAFTDDTCPVCEQKLPADKLEENKRKFNVSKAEKLDAIEHELNAIKALDNTLACEKQETEKKIAESKEQLVQLEARAKELDIIISAKEKEFEAEIKKEIEKITAEMSTTKDKIIALELSTEDEVTKIVEEIVKLKDKIKPMQNYISEKNLLAKQEARIEELKAEQQTLSDRYTVLEKQIYLIEQFTRIKVAAINDKVNKHFKYARFKLFNQQENGGIAETCEATYKGVPYRDLNTAGKILIGMDIINTLSKQHGVCVPIFIDNKEAVTGELETLAQRIELIVSEQDKELRIERIEN